ncbi:MAG TPA: 50S ribosomal protein L24 [Candidatus Acidoferrum sp.]|nr:50S ribosomal protein L24 [Candidatus Acidoferrum sp.]
MKLTAKPSKQRRIIYQAPDHIRRKLFAAPLSAELQASHGIKSLPIRNGDTVRIMRGDHKGFEGKISRIDQTHFRVYVEGLTREKVDGTAIFVPVHPSKVTIKALVLDDKWRKNILERKKQTRKKVRETVTKQLEVIAEPKESAEKEGIVKEKVGRKKPAEKKRREIEKLAGQKPEKEKEKTELKQGSKRKRQTTTREDDKKTGGA